MVSQKRKDSIKPYGHKLLANRYILDAAIQADWSCSSNGWAYPVYSLTGEHVTGRWKAFDSKAVPKYRWIPNKPDTAKYYFVGDIQQAIRSQRNTVFIANGEPGVLTFISAGKQNAMSWYGENSIPSSIANDLASIGVETIMYACDNDDAGRKSAVKLRDMLIGSGISTIFLDLKRFVTHKGDVNDLWIDCKGDHHEFWRKWRLLDTLLLPAPETHTHKPHTTYSDAETDTDLIRNIASLLGISDTPRNSQGWTRKPICNPLRKDKQPSAKFNFQSGVLKDFSTGDAHSPYELAHHFGIARNRVNESKSSHFEPKTGANRIQSDKKQGDMESRLNSVTIPTLSNAELVNIAELSIPI